MLYAQRLLASTLHQAAKTYLKHSCDVPHGWRTGFEFLVWHLLHHDSGPLTESDVGRARSLLRAELEELRQLELDAGGWMTWSRPAEKLVFVDQAEWLRLYADYTRPLSR